MEELGQLKSMEFASVRCAEGEGGDEALMAVEDDSGLVSNGGSRICVCVIPMSVICTFNAIWGREKLQ